MCCLDYLDQPVITAAPTSPKEGEDLLLTCTATATDDFIAKYVWYRDDVQIAEGMSNTHPVVGGDSDDSGQYKCKVVTGTRALEKTSDPIAVKYEG